MDREPQIELIKFTVKLGASDNGMPELAFHIGMNEKVIKDFYEFIGEEAPLEELNKVLKDYAVAVSELLNLGESSYYTAGNDTRDTNELVERLEGKGKLVS